jgi:hypothetical protein
VRTAAFFTRARRSPKATLSKTSRWGKSVALEDGVDLAAVWRRGRHVDVVEQDLSLVGALEAGDQPQGRRLAATRGAKQREELTRLDRDVDPVDGRDLPELLAKLDEVDGAGAHLTPPAPRSR